MANGHAFSGALVITNVQQCKQRLTRKKKKGESVEFGLTLEAQLLAGADNNLITMNCLHE